MTLSNNYRMAITEVLEILKNVEIDEYNKIPKKTITFLEEQKDPNYIFTIKPNQNFEDIKIMDETKGFLSFIYYSYICNSDEERKLYLITLNHNEKKFQDELRKKYEYSNLFNDKTEKKENLIVDNDTTQMVKYKQNFFIKFINTIKKIFKKY
ncbi:MAG: hypothetical protein IJH39_02825 [Clostridia bacterium]|nr:hypothetical protein [Clostridia bacterium]